MRNGHLPLGYRIENGRAVVDEEKAGQIRQVYEGYLSGLSYEEAAKAAGFSMNHGSVKSMLQNRHYLGDEYYPAIIDRESYDAAETERQRRSKALGRDNRPKKKLKPRHVPVRFTLGTCEKKLEDPYEQAAYMYSLIESE